MGRWVSLHIPGGLRTHYTLQAAFELLVRLKPHPGITGSSHHNQSFHLKVGLLFRTLVLTFYYRRTWGWSGSGISTGISKQWAQGSHSEKHYTLGNLLDWNLVGKLIMKCPMAILPWTKSPFPNIPFFFSQTTPFLIPSQGFWSAMGSLSSTQIKPASSPVIHDKVWRNWWHIMSVFSFVHFQSEPHIRNIALSNSFIIDIRVEHLDKWLRWGSHRLFPGL